MQRSKRFETHAAAALSRLAFGLGLTVALVLWTACGGQEEADIQESLDETGTMDLMDEIADDTYEPPADGELTGEQIEMFLEVRDRAQAIREVAEKNLDERTQDTEGTEQEPGLFDTFRAMGDVGDFVTADLRAAHELDYNTAEYQWVEETVVGAYSGHWVRQAQSSFAGQMAESRGAMRTQLEAMIAEAETEEEKEQLRTQLADWEQSMDESIGEMEAQGELSAAERHNLELVLEHEAEIRGALMPEEAGFLPIGDDAANDGAEATE